MLEQRIQQQFFDSADLKYQAAETLARALADASQALVTCLTAGGRVFAAGAGASAPLAQLLVGELVGRFERERPGLAAAALGADASLLAAMADGGLEAALARQLETLGAPGDLLLVLDPDGEHPLPRALAEAAHGKDMTVIALTGRQGTALREVLGETDVLLAVPHDRRARVLEAQLLMLHCLADAIDLQLLGEQDPA